MITDPLPLANQIACMLEALCKLVAREGRRLHMPRPLIVLAWNRVAHLANRLLSLVHRLNEGKLPPPGAAPRRPASPRPATAASWRTRHIAWLLRMMRDEVRACAGALEHFLSLPEMADLVREAPQVGRVLRPLCRMMAVKPPAWLRLPPRTAPAPPSPALPDPAPAGPLLPPPDPEPLHPPDPEPLHPPDPEPLHPPDAAVFAAVSQKLA